jgi:hypothetical protein
LGLVTGTVCRLASDTDMGTVSPLASDTDMEPGL